MIDWLMNNAEPKNVSPNSDVRRILFDLDPEMTPLDRLRPDRGAHRTAAGMVATARKANTA
jgi:hypothetical protein